MRKLSCALREFTFVQIEVLMEKSFLAPCWPADHSCLRNRAGCAAGGGSRARDRKSTRLNSSHLGTSYAVFCLKKTYKERCTFIYSAIKPGYARIRESAGLNFFL